MSIKNIATLTAAAAAILGGLAIEASAGPSCGTGGGGYASARYSAPRAVSLAPKPIAAKPIAAKAAPAPRQRVAEAAPVSAKPAPSKVVSLATADSSNGAGDATAEKVAKSAAPIQATVNAASAQPVAEILDNAETSVSAIAARLAAMNGRRSAVTIE